MKPYGKQTERHWCKGEDCRKHAKHFKHKARQINKKLSLGDKPVSEHQEKEQEIFIANNPRYTWWCGCEMCNEIILRKFSHVSVDPLDEVNSK